MSEAALPSAPTSAKATTRESIFAGHPKGLGPLFFTELWERFSYYGMRAVLIFYLTASLAEGGLGYDIKFASSTIWGNYVMAVYLMSLPGGLIADYVTGARRAVLIGGIIIACGHFTMVIHSVAAFYVGLSLIALGTGLLKPNISAMVGGLYKENDPRRDSGFSIFYMGINIGALAAPLVVGYFAKGESFKRFLSSMGFDPVNSWHWGFGAAGVGMVVGLVVYVWNRDKLAHVGNKVKKLSKADAENKSDEIVQPPLTKSDWKRIVAIFIFFVFTILFWGAYEQKGASLNLFADRLTNTEIFGIRFPAPYLQSLTPLFVIMLTPVFSILWVRLGDRQPSSPVKFTLGMLFIGLAYVLLIPAVMLTAQGRISFWWLVGVYFLEVCGEMCLSPVGLSTVTKLSPPKLVGIMLGVWFLASALGSKLAGYLSGFFVSDNYWQLVKLYGGIAVGLLVATVILALMTPMIKRLMGTVR